MANAAPLAAAHVRATAIEPHDLDEAAVLALQPTSTVGTHHAQTTQVPRTLAALEAETVRSTA